MEGWANQRSASLCSSQPSLHPKIITAGVKKLLQRVQPDSCVVTAHIGAKHAAVRNASLYARLTCAFSSSLLLGQGCSPAAQWGVRCPTGGRVAGRPAGRAAECGHRRNQAAATHRGRGSRTKAPGCRPGAERLLGEACSPSEPPSCSSSRGAAGRSARVRRRRRWRVRPAFMPMWSREEMLLCFQPSTTICLQSHLKGVFD